MPKLETSPVVQPMTLKDLKQAAKQERWDEVDQQIPLVSNHPVYIQWALRQGFKQKDQNLRDLAVSLIEQSSVELNTQQIDRITHLMQTDTHIYVRYRSAFALFTHGLQSEEVVTMLKQASTDKDVQEIAKSYLFRLSSK